jgi:regulator of RNase E activity RraA
MIKPTDFASLAPTAFAGVIGRDRVMDIGMRPLWSGMPRLAGPAYTARCTPGDNLMLHAAIYRAPAGSVLVVEGADADYALAGGNVCRIAQRNGIAGFVVDGVVRDLSEIREIRFPVFARGVIPIPGSREGIGTLDRPIRCGGALVEPGDIVIADEEGIVVLPAASAGEMLARAGALEAADVALSLDEWEAKHRARVEGTLREKHFPGAR